MYMYIIYHLWCDEKCPSLYNVQNKYIYIIKVFDLDMASENSSQIKKSTWFLYIFSL